MIGIAGAGAFGAALATAIASQGRDVQLWARDPVQVRAMAQSREIAKLPGMKLPKTVSITAEITDLLTCETILLATPMQAFGGFLAQHGTVLNGHRALVACCKGVDLATLQGPTAMIAAACPNAVPMILTGPSFAVDIARGLATALTLASRNEAACTLAQEQISGPILRIYRNSDVIGAELGGALKNVMAIAAGIVIGAGLGDSARAALMTRGFAEMTRFATHLGARPETLMGLSGFGDLVLTCTSAQSRNFRHGQALGRGDPPDPHLTVEGVATAIAVLRQAETLGIAQEIPVTTMVAAVTQGKIGIQDAVHALMSRPLKEE